MKKIWFNVSCNNAFMFRTDPEQDSYRAEWTEAELVRAFPGHAGFKVIRREETSLTTSTEITKP